MGKNVNENDQPILTLILVPKTTSGFFTTLCLKKYLSYLVTSEIKVIEVMPCQLKRVVIPENVTAIYVGDLGRKNCDTAAIDRLIKKYSEKIIFWADNHPEDDQIPEMKGKENYFHAPLAVFPSCAALLNKLWGDKIAKPEWVAAANYFENQDNPISPLAMEYKKIMHLAHVKDIAECSDGSSSKYIDEAKIIYSEYLLCGTNINIVFSFLDKYEKIIAGK